MTVDGPNAQVGVLHPRLQSAQNRISSENSPYLVQKAGCETGSEALLDDVRTLYSPTGSTAKQASLAERRSYVVEWIRSITGVQLPSDSDQVFRSKLRDGVLLCKILNAVKPGTITRIVDVNILDSNTGEVIQTMENVTNFLKGVHAVGLPGEYIFSVGDLEDDGPTERPRVVDCLICLKRMSEGQKLTGHFSTPARSPFAAFPYRRPSSTYARPPLGTPMSDSQSEGDDNGLTPPGGKAAAGKGVAAAVGVTRLMQQCTAMLRERMWTDTSQAGRTVQTPTPPRGMGGGTPESALEAMGPVLESVLGSLTQEYEKRLLAKDHEMKTMQDSLQAEQARRRALESELNLAKNALSLAEAQASSAGASAAQTEETSAAMEKVQTDLKTAQEESSRLRIELAEFEENAESAQKQLRLELLDAKERLDSLADLEEAYKKVCDENRNLYNTVQDLRGAIRVYCRVRPSGKTGDDSASCLDICDGEIACYNQKGHRKLFQFDKVFGEASTQDDVYGETAPLIRSVLDGYNVCIFAYGQTGSGKTHTMSGTNVVAPEGRGINYRSLDDLFNIAAQRSDEWQYSISVQMLEIYNETLRDLLVDGSVSRKDNRLDIRMTERSGNNVPDAMQVDVSCTEDVLEVMARGARNRAVGETKMNDRSSRSHQVLTVMVDGRNSVTGAHSHACLNLIDLAGSERVLRSEAAGDRLKEAQHINKSLSALGDVMNALANGSSHVPYRNSKLTQLLQDSLGGQAKTMMFMHIAPEMSSYGETVSTLGFGTRVAEVTLGAAKQNREGAELFAAREEIARLEAGNKGVDATVESLKAELASQRSDRAEALARAQRAEEELQAARQEMEKLKAAQPAPGPAQNKKSLALDLARIHENNEDLRGDSSHLKVVTTRESHLPSGVPSPAPRSVTSHVQRLRSKENSAARNAPASKLQRPQTARTEPQSSLDQTGSRGSLTSRGERPGTAHAGRRQSLGGPQTPSGIPSASRVPRYTRNASAASASASKPGPRTAASGSSGFGSSTNLNRSGRMSAGTTGRWI
uniref:Kinesin family member C2/C3 n=1 Tax=Tetraselmis sp. GSL018 TaxID=582737 RepID=A0A061S3R0_9CHLO